jgi:competence protein ComEA
MRLLLFAAAISAYLCAAATSISARSTVNEPSARQAGTQSPFPPGPGREVLLKACGGCHPAEKVIAELKTKDDWNNTLFDMAANGAEASDEEYAQILEYLDKNFSAIQVNKASAEELAAKLDVPQDVAAGIIRYRDQNGGKIASLDELKKVPQLDAAKVDARKDRLRF